MIKRSQTWLTAAVLSLFIAILSFACLQARASSNGVLDVTVSSAPMSMKVELFEVGAPYQSRQIIENWPSQSGLAWSNLFTKPQYFIRITDRNTGRVRQTYGFYIADGSPSAISVDFYAPNFVQTTHNLN